MIKSTSSLKKVLMHNRTIQLGETMLLLVYHLSGACRGTRAPLSTRNDEQCRFYLSRRRLICSRPTDDDHTPAPRNALPVDVDVYATAKGPKLGIWDLTQSQVDLCSIGVGEMPE